jgi:hypothetical protein
MPRRLAVEECVCGFKYPHYQAPECHRPDCPYARCPKCNGEGKYLETFSSNQFVTCQECGGVTSTPFNFRTGP